MAKKQAIIIGAGPAGLTAALELLRRTDIQPVVLEASDKIGGLSRTEIYKGNHIDIGGHRFFSQSEEVRRWWQDILPLGEGMMERRRVSRIYFLRRFFDYPISLCWQTFANLGWHRVWKIGLGYLAACLHKREEKTLEDFFINRFGRELYATFFRDYTQKVWGVPCHEIPADWGRQRVKGLSIRKVLQDACGKRLHLGRKRAVETSLIKRFWYPQYGPGQLWEKVAALVEEKGGIIRRQSPVVRIDWQAGAVRRVWTKEKDGSMQGHEAELFFSTMPIRHLIESMGEKVPATVRNVAKGLVYRDFITAGILVDRLKLRQAGGMIPDNWIYIQEKEVRLGRLQIFNNWSPYMAADKDKVWLGLEYFCQEGDALWQMPDDAFIHFAVNELAKIDIIEAQSVRDAVVIHVPKAYPAYFGTYGRLGEVRRFTDSLANLYLLGRNGQHRYNNMDHSMLTAMRAVDAVSRGSRDKTAVWSVNTEASYHETCGQEG